MNPIHLQITDFEEAASVGGLFHYRHSAEPPHHHAALMRVMPRICAGGTVRVREAAPAEFAIVITRELPQADRNCIARATLEDAMTEERGMWIFAGAVTLLILAMMGAGMLWGHHDTASNEPTDISSQSRVPSPK
jgi:hypothetical protein